MLQVERASSTIGAPARPTRAEARGPNTRAIEFRSFSTLKDLPPEPEWLWSGYVARGSVTMLAGHPFAGKSMLVGGLLRAMRSGEPFLGRPTHAATAVVVTEEDDAALRQRAAVLDLFGNKSAYVSRSGGALSVSWPDLIAAATGEALKRKHGLLVVDTFPGLAGLGGDDENDAGAIAERLRPLQQAAGEGLAVLFLHHMNRFGQPRGSKAFLGVVDVSTRFLRNGSSAAFRLNSTSRFPVATPTTLQGSLQRGPDGWFYRPGDNPSVRRVDTEVRGTAEGVCGKRSRMPDPSASPTTNSTRSRG